MKKIYLIDWNNFIYRMFYWLPEFTTKDWKIVNAIFWMAKFFVNQLIKEKPDYLFFIKDAKWDNFRHKLYSEYKSTRDRMPDNLRSQINDIEKMIKMMWVDIIELNWYEADDIIWTLSRKLWDNKENNIYILSWDKDLYSLVSDNVKIYDTMKKKIFDIEKTKEKFQVEPKKIIDYLAIVWDKSDNIPWIEWFWPQKAVALINEIWTIEDIYNEVEKIENKEKTFLDYSDSVSSCFKWKTYEKLVNSKENAFLSKKLATIELNANLDNLKIENFKFNPNLIFNENVKKYFKENEFYSLIWEEEQKLKKWNGLKLNVKIIQNKKDLDLLWNKITKYKEVIIDTETTSLNIIEADLVWISIFLDNDNIYYINRLHKWESVTDIDLKNFLNNLFSFDILIVWHNLKYDLEILDLYRKNKKNSKNSTENHWQMTFGI